MQATVVASRGSRALVGVATVALVVLVAVITLGIVAASPSGNEERVPLRSIADGASLQRVDGHAVVFVRRGDLVTAYLPQIPTGDALVWCASSESFSTALHATRYSIDGRRLSGPGPAQLDRYATHLDGDTVVVSTGHRFDSPPVPWSDALVAQWTSAPAGVC